MYEYIHVCMYVCMCARVYTCMFVYPIKDAVIRAMIPEFIVQFILQTTAPQ